MSSYRLTFGGLLLLGARATDLLARTGRGAGRWHLWHNLAEHVEKITARHRACWPQPTEA